ncbi:unannotated protein [freshwater metagenome]|uniref:Unannotated protein n=1 Tax=freshwater metagenome TaxID=449393 RepID=A0A6J6RC21_9ZZZZ
MAIRRRLSLIALAAFAIDLITKSAALTYLDSAPRKILGSFLQLELTFNSGAAFNLANSKTIFLTLFAVVVAAFILFFGGKITSPKWAYGLGLMLGGIFGNLSDRIFRAPGALQGEVVDWIKVSYWPTFNLADTSIVLGAGLIILLSARNINPIDRNS